MTIGGVGVAPSRMHFLDGVRALAAMFVVVHHAWLTVYPDFEIHGPVGAATYWMSFGSFGVTVFIVVSGFSLMLSPARNGGRLRDGALSFFRGRFRRIVIPYWFALAISVLLALTVVSQKTGTHWDSSLPVTWESAIVHVFLFQDFAYGSSINHVLWTIALEWHIYFLFPLLLLIWRKVDPVVSTLLVLAATTVVSVAMEDSGMWFFKSFNFIGCFAVGALGAHTVHARGKLMVLGRTVAPRWTLVSGGFFGVAAVLAVTTRNYGLVNPVLSIAASALIVSMALGKTGWLRRVLEARVLVWIGVSSYSLYLLHAPIEQMIYQYLMAPLGLGVYNGVSLLVLVPVGLVTSIFVTRLFFLAVEMRFMGSPKLRIAKPSVREEAQV
ncbi:acyltransferase family protein [Arthrobacter sp. UYCu723]